MATREVQIRVTVDDADAIKKLDALAAKLDKLKEMHTIRIGLDDGGASAKLDQIAAKLDKMGSKDVTPKVNVDGITEASLELDKLILKLDEFGHKRETAHVRVSSGGKSLNTVDALLKDIFGGGGKGGGGGNSLAKDAAAGGGGFFSGLLSAGAGANNQYMGGLIAALVAYAAAIGPAIIPFGLGGLIGGGAAFGGLKIGATDRTQLLALEQNLRTATPGTRQARIAQQQLTLFRQQNGPGIQLGNVEHGFTTSLKNSFLGALTSPSQGFSGHPGSSFLQGLTPILSQVAGFVKSIGPSLGNLFRSALPSLAAFVKIGEQFAKAVIPAITQSLKALGPSLPTIVQGFKLLSQGIAGFIRDLGPGMKDAALIFKGSMEVVKGFLQLVGFAASLFAKAIVNTGRIIRTVARDIPREFDTMRHDIASIFDSVRHDIAAAWDAVYSNTIARVGHMVQSVMNFDARLRHGISSDFDSIRHTIAAAWDAIYAATIGKVVALVSTVIHWFSGLPGKIHGALASLPGIMASIGAAALNGLLHGLESGAASVLGFISSLGSKIAGAIAGIGGGALSTLGGIASKVLHFAAGGTITEPIVGRGLSSGAMYTFGEGGLHEQVTPLGHGGSHGGGAIVNVYVADGVNPDQAALRVVQSLRKYKQRHGNAVLGIA